MSVQRKQATMKKPALLIPALLFTITCLCQETRAETQQNAMQKLHWLAGIWKGKSELNAGGKRQTTNIQEIIKPALDGTIYTVLAKGTAMDSATQKQVVVYNSFGVVSYDEKSRQYRWKTWRNPGEAYDENAFKVGDNSFEYVASENGGSMRYKANLDETGQWIETGEYSKDNATWAVFITMKLTRK